MRDFEVRNELLETPVADLDANHQWMDQIARNLAAGGTPAVEGFMSGAIDLPEAQFDWILNRQARLEAQITSGK